MTEPMSDERLECGMCGGQMSRNPHSDAGLPSRLSDVGAVWECIPCAVGGRSKAYWRAVKAEGEADRLRADNERLREVLRDIAYNTSTSIPFAAPPETYIVGQLHSCIGRAARALNPEPSA